MNELAEIWFLYNSERKTPAPPEDLRARRESFASPENRCILTPGSCRESFALGSTPAFCSRPKLPAVSYLQFGSCKKQSREAYRRNIIYRIYVFEDRLKHIGSGFEEW